MKYLPEIGVYNAVRKYLLDQSAVVFQLVAPGGQAPLSVTYRLNGARRTCFPDLIAIEGACLFIGEMKPKYSASDHAKVLDMLDFGGESLIAMVSRIDPLRSASIETVSGLLCHSQISAPVTNNISQWIFDRSGDLVEKKFRAYERKLF